MKKLSIIIPMGGGVSQDLWRARAAEWVLHRYHATLDAEIVLGNSHQVPFSRSDARNTAVQNAMGSVLLFADADTVFHARQIQAGLSLLREGAPWVICYGLGRYYNLGQEATEQVLWSNPTWDIPEPQDPKLWEHKLDSWAGLLLVPRTAWEEVGGYDARFRGWGGEDNAFQMALDTLVGPHERVDDYVLHLWHERGLADFGHPLWDHNARLLSEYREAFHRPTRMRALLDKGSSL